MVMGLPAEAGLWVERNLSLRFGRPVAGGTQAPPGGRGDPSEPGLEAHPSAAHSPGWVRAVLSDQPGRNDRQRMPAPRPRSPSGRHPPGAAPPPPPRPPYAVERPANQACPRSTSCAAWALPGPRGRPPPHRPTSHHTPLALKRSHQRPQQHRHNRAERRQAAPPSPASRSPLRWSSWLAALGAARPGRGGGVAATAGVDPGAGQGVAIVAEAAPVIGRGALLAEPDRQGVPSSSYT
jgi:hypothetical protein